MATSRYFEEDLRCGDSFYIQITYDATTNPAGLTHTFTMRPDWDSEPVIQVEKIAPAEPDYGIDPKVVTIRLSPEETALIEPGKYVWDLQVKTPDTDDVVTILPEPAHYNDRIRVVPQVTVDAV